MAFSSVSARSARVDTVLRQRIFHVGQLHVGDERQARPVRGRPRCSRQPVAAAATRSGRCHSASIGQRSVASSCFGPRETTATARDSAAVPLRRDRRGRTPASPVGPGSRDCSRARSRRLRPASDRRRARRLEEWLCPGVGRAARALQSAGRRSSAWRPTSARAHPAPAIRRLTAAKERTKDMAWSLGR